MGVQQAGTALCTRGSINPSELIHLSRILQANLPLPIHDWGGKSRNSQEREKRRQSKSLRKVLEAAHSIAVILSSCNKLPPVQGLPLASCLLAVLAPPTQKKAKSDKPREPLRWTKEDPRAALVRNGVQTKSARAKITTLAARKVDFYSVPFEHLSDCSSAPLSAHYRDASHWLATCCGFLRSEGRELEGGGRWS